MNEMAKKRESTPGENLAKQIIEQYHPKKGSVLFIDEAYSLVDDKNGSFGSGRELSTMFRSTITIRQHFAK